MAREDLLSAFKRSLRKYSAFAAILNFLKTGQVSLTRVIRMRKKKQFLVARESMSFRGGGYHTFFGYHDITPFSRDGTRILACRVPSNADGGRAVMEIGCYPFKTSSDFIAFDSTTAWCWQMGARLQWWGGDDTCVSYNKTIDGKHCTVVHDIGRRKVVRTYDRALYGIAPDLRHGVSLNFSRLQRLRPGYGYKDRPDETIADLMPDDDGLWLVDLESGASRLVLSCKEAAALCADGDDGNNAEHYFNHVLWSPDSERFLFLHLSMSPDGSRTGRAFVYDIKKESCEPLELSGYISHFAWRNPSEVLMYSRNERTGVGLNLYKLATGDVRAVARRSVRRDCHPMFSPVDKNVVLLDSYPVRPLMERELYLLDIEKDTRIDLACFYSPPHLSGEHRCDLHPRWDRTGGWVAVDSAHANARQLVAVAVPR